MRLRFISLSIQLLRYEIDRVELLVNPALLVKLTKISDKRKNSGEENTCKNEYLQ